MSYNWGPNFLVPTDLIKKYSGRVILRETLNRDILAEELDALGLAKGVARITNPWYFRKKDTDTWIKIGESDDESQDFPVAWDTSGLENGQYQVLGLMHVYVKEDGSERAIARQNIVDVAVEN
jgi:hypothetical protein